MKDSTPEEGKEVPAFKQELWYRIVDAWGKHKNTPTEIYNALSGLYEEFIIPKIESATKEPLPSLSIEAKKKMMEYGLPIPESIESIKAWANHLNETYGKAQSEYEARIKALTAHIESDKEIQKMLSGRIDELTDCLRGITDAAEEAVELQFPPDLIRKMKKIVNPTGLNYGKK